MGTRPDRTVRSASRLVVLAALICCVALVEVPAVSAKSGRVRIDGAGGSATATGPNGPVTRSGEGTVDKDGAAYLVCVPYFAIGIPHTFEIRNGDTVVDSFTYTVPSGDGSVEDVTTAKGVKIAIRTDHTEGVNGSPSKGCFTYKVRKSKSSKNVD